MLLDAGADIDRLGTLTKSALYIHAIGFATSPKDGRFPLVRYLVRLRLPRQRTHGAEEALARPATISVS